MRRFLLGMLVAASCLTGQPAILPVDQIRADMEGVARTVFRGQVAEEFPLRILGVLKNSGPGQDIILARLLTDRLEQTGVMQGMSGSPVYVGGKLIGAIAFAFPFAKEPIAGIRPIGEMLAVESRRSPLRAARVHLGSTEIRAETAIQEANAPVAVLTPVSMGGMTERAVQYFAPQWKQMGFVLQQGASGNRPTAAATSLSAGDMISVQLLRGDISVGADGTVTHVDGNQMYAFGHRFLGGGAVEFPFAKAEVITPLANWNMPFKISQATSQTGTILFDGDAAVRGELGRQPKMTPLRIRYRDASGVKQYKIEMVRHSLLSPLLLQMAVFSTLDHHFRSAGAGTVDMKGLVRFAGITKPLEITGRYAGDNNLPIAASLGAAIPMAFFQQHVEDGLLPESIEFDLESKPVREQWVIEAACEQIAAWRQGDSKRFAELSVSVNLSAVQLRNSGLLAVLASSMQRHAIPPGKLELEITETTLMEGVEINLQKLQHIRALGIGLAIDDFGTGYSSLSYLSRFPINKLKIDRSFVHEILDDPNNLAITRLIISLGHTLGLKVIAEGVETEAQALLLRSAGCDQFQGFLYAAPMAEAELSNWQPAPQPPDVSSVSSAAAIVAVD